MPKFILHTLLFSLILAVCACTPGTKPKLAEKPNADVKPNLALPTVEVHQTFNLSYSQLWTATMSSLQRRNIGVDTFDQAAGVIQSNWVNTTDAMCGTDDPSRAQLNCRVRLKFQLDTISDDASGIHGSYEELCFFTEEIRLECPNSRAEKLLLGLIGDLRALDDAQENPQH